MRLVSLVVAGWLAGGVAACGSDESSGGSGGATGTATNEAGKTSGSSGSSSSGSAAGGSSSQAGKINAAAGAATAGTATAGSPTAGSANGTLSPACQKFCDCHDANCASLPIPGGKSCAAFCEAMTEEQLACRQNMCKLVPDQPDNDHCKHSLGIDQCL